MRAGTKPNAMITWLSNPKGWELRLWRSKSNPNQVMTLGRQLSWRRVVLCHHYVSQKTWRWCVKVIWPWPSDMSLDVSGKYLAIRINILPEFFWHFFVDQSEVFPSSHVTPNFTETAPFGKKFNRRTTRIVSMVFLFWN